MPFLFLWVNPKQIVTFFLLFQISEYFSSIYPYY